MKSSALSRIAVVVLACLASIAGGLSLGRGGAGAAVSQRRPLIGFSADTLKEERWQHDVNFFVERAKTLGADVLVQAANSDDTRQIRDIEALISRKVDVLVVVPHDGAAMAKAVAMAHEAGIPVIAYDRIILNSDLDFYVTFDVPKIGATQAQYLIDRIKPGHKMRVVRINGAKTDHDAFLVREGQDRALKPYIQRGQLEIVHDDWAAEWKPEVAKKIVNAAITRFGHGIDAVLAANDGTAGGAIQALTEEGLVGKVLVTGGDGELAACQRIVHGTQSMTVFQPVNELAAHAAEVAVKMARKRPVIATAETSNKLIEVPTAAVDVVAMTRSNMTELAVKRGYLRFDDIYRDAPPALRPPRPG